MGGLKIPSVLYSPDLAVNLISAGVLYDSGHDIKWSSKAATVYSPDGEELATFYRDPNDSRLWQTTVRSSENAFSVRKSLLRTDFATLWHRRLGHLHPAGVIHYLKSNKIGDLSLKDFVKCDTCSLGKSIRAPTTSPFHRSTIPLACIHSDLLGPINPESKGKKKYIMSFIDDATRFNFIYLLGSKHEAFRAFKHFQKWVENNTAFKVLKLKSDRGGEYSSTKFLNHLNESAIDIKRGPANRPTTNGVAERFNRTLLGRMRTQLLQ